MRREEKNKKKQNLFILVQQEVLQWASLSALPQDTSLCDFPGLLLSRVILAVVSAGTSVFQAERK